jgi:hypothetical protein
MIKNKVFRDSQDSLTALTSVYSFLSYEKLFNLSDQQFAYLQNVKENI